VAVVYAEVSDAMSQAGVDDCAILTLQFQNGVVATLDPSWSRLAGHPAPVDVTLEAVGTMGVAHWDAFADHVNFWRGHTPYTIPVSESMDVRLIRAFVQAVTVGKASSLLATGVDGLRGVEIMVAAYQSAALRKPVAIGPVPF
jgi:predicted dehydrogenase